jgi:hypothetical protein
MMIGRCHASLTHTGVAISRRRAGRLLAGGLLAVSVSRLCWTEASAQDAKPGNEGEPASDAAAPEEQLTLAYADEMLVESFRLPEGQSPRRELHSTDVRINTFLHHTGPGGQEVSAAWSIDPQGKLRFRVVQIREANIHDARDHITADAIYGTLAKYFVPFPEAFTSAIWKQFRQPSGAPTIERTWDNEDGSLETVGAALWGQNSADGPGNYLVVRARLFPGSPHHERRTLFTS